MRWMLPALLLFLCHASQAANCGGVTACNCEDSVTSNYTLLANLSCPYMQDGMPALYIAASSVTVDLNGYTISCVNSYPIQPWQDAQVQFGFTPDQDSTGVQTASDSLTGMTLKDSIGTGAIDGCGIGVASQGHLTTTGVHITNSGYAGIQHTAAGGDTDNGGTTISGTFGFPIYVGSAGNTISDVICIGNYGDIDSNSGGCVAWFTSASVAISNLTISASGDSAFRPNGNSTAGSTATGVVITGQKSGLLSSGAPPSWFGTTNITENGAPVLYYATCPSLIDGNVLGTVAYLYCAAATNTTIQNVTALESIWIDNCTGTCLITNATVTGVTTQARPIYITGTGSLSVTNSKVSNSFVRQGSAITLTGAGTLTAAGNTVDTDEGGILLNGGGTPVLTGNKYLGIMMGQTSGVGSTGETFLYPTRYAGGMISWTDGTRAISLNGTASFSFSMYLPDGSTVCPSCAYTAVSYPTETVSSSQSSNTVTGSFVAHTAGLYSLLVTVTDTNGNMTKKNFVYFVGSLTQITTEMYFRFGASTNTVNGGGMDGQPMKLTAPGETDWGYCNGWVQFSPSDAMPFPFAELTQVAPSITYSTYPGKTTQTPQSVFGIQRFNNYVGNPDSVPTPVTTAATMPFIFGSATPTLSSLSYAMDSPLAWNALALILNTNGSPVNGTDFPIIVSTSITPSDANFTYSYPTAGFPVKSISNIDIHVLSDTGSTIMLDNASGAIGTQAMTITSLSASHLYAVSIDGIPAVAFTSNSSGDGSITVSVGAGIHAMVISPLSASMGGSINVSGGSFIN